MSASTPFKFLTLTELNKNLTDLTLKVMKKHGLNVEDREAAEKNYSLLPEVRRMQLELIDDTIEHLYHETHIADEEKAVIATGAYLKVKQAIYDSYKFVTPERSAVYTGIPEAIGETLENPLDEKTKLKALAAYELYAVNYEAEKKQDKDLREKFHDVLFYLEPSDAEEYSITNSDSDSDSETESSDDELEPDEIEVQVQGKNNCIDETSKVDDLGLKHHVLNSEKKYSKYATGRSKSDFVFTQPGLLSSLSSLWRVNNNKLKGQLEFSPEVDKVEEQAQQKVGLKV